MTSYCEPAAKVIEKLGGVQAVASLLDMDESSIRRYRLPAPVGTGGIIPDHVKVALIKASRGRLTWADFKPPQLRSRNNG